MPVTRSFQMPEHQLRRSGRPTTYSIRSPDTPNSSPSPKLNRVSSDTHNTRRSVNSFRSVPNHAKASSAASVSSHTYTNPTSGGRADSFPTGAHHTGSSDSSYSPVVAPECI